VYRKFLTVNKHYQNKETEIQVSRLSSAAPGMGREVITHLTCK